MNTSIDLATASQSQMQLGDAYLLFQLRENTLAAFEVKYIQEVVAIPFESIATMSNMSESITGFMSWRDRIIWTIDLGMLFNLDEIDCDRPENCNVIIIRVKSKTLGLIVPRIQGTVNLVSEKIQFSQSKSQLSLTPYLQGWVYRDGKQMLILDAVGISESERLWSDKRSNYLAAGKI